jgi:hypothetical protein
MSGDVSSLSLSAAGGPGSSSLVGRGGDEGNTGSSSSGGVDADDVGEPDSLSLADCGGDEAGVVSSPPSIGDNPVDPDSLSSPDGVGVGDVEAGGTAAESGWLSVVSSCDCSELSFLPGVGGGTVG